MGNQNFCVSNEYSGQSSFTHHTTAEKYPLPSQLCLTFDDSLNALIRTPPKSQNETPNYGLKISYGSDGWNKPVTWLVPDYIPGTGVGILFSASMGLKTFIALHLAGCVATNTQFLNMPTRKGIVFYVGAEGATGLPRRLKGFEQHNNVSCGKKFVLLPQPLSMVNDDARNALRRIITAESESQQEDPVLLVLDTFSQCSAGIDENSAGQVAEYLNYCTELANEFGMTVLVIHHSSKSGGYRGSSTLLANVDFSLETNRLKPEVPVKTMLSVIKNKEGSTGLNAEFELSPIELGISDSAGRPVSTLVVTHAQQITTNVTPQGTRDIDMSIIRGQFTDSNVDLVRREKLLTTLASKFPDIALSTIDKRVSQACNTLVEMGILLEEKMGRNKAYRVKSIDNSADDRGLFDD
jgi:hypothetical protein